MNKWFLAWSHESIKRNCSGRAWQYTPIIPALRGLRWEIEITKRASPPPPPAWAAKRECLQTATANRRTWSTRSECASSCTCFACLLHTRRVWKPEPEVLVPQPQCASFETLSRLSSLPSSSSPSRVVMKIKKTISVKFSALSIMVNTGRRLWCFWP